MLITLALLYIEKITCSIPAAIRDQMHNDVVNNIMSISHSAYKIMIESFVGPKPGHVHGHHSVQGVLRRLHHMINTGLPEGKANEGMCDRSYHGLVNVKVIMCLGSKCQSRFKWFLSILMITKCQKKKQNMFWI